MFMPRYWLPSPSAGCSITHRVHWTFRTHSLAFTPDENYVYYLLSYHGLMDDVVRESITFVNWDEPVKRPGGGQSPKTYTQCTPLDLARFTLYESTLFARKFTIGSNIAQLLKALWADPKRTMPVPRLPDLLHVTVKPMRGGWVGEVG